MGEKGENMTPETVSLPPNYAPSETYTETPPPAYEKNRASWVQVARMVCMTVLAAAFLIGFFILTSAWLQARSTCDCQTHQVDGPISSASFAGGAPRHEPLVGKVQLDKKEDLSLDLNNNVLEDKASEEVSAEEQTEEEKQEQQQPVEDTADFENEQEDMQVLAPDQELEVLDEILEEEAEMEEERNQLEEEMRAQMQEMRKRIQLPSSLLLGNPMLAGRDVNCEVERRQQQLAPGIVSKIIVVTCDNDDEDDSEESPQLLQAPVPLDGRLMPPMIRPAPEITPSGPKRLGPPFSILAPILKMIAAREGAKKKMQTPTPLAPIASMPQERPEPMVRLQTGPPPPKPIVAIPAENRPRELPPMGSRVPIPFGPLRFISGAPRMLNMPLMPDPRRRDGPLMPPRGPMPMPQGPMGLPQGLIPLRILPEPLLPLQPRPMPEARGRALSSPVNLPPFNLRLLNLPLSSFMKPKLELRPRIMPITHMEMMRPHHQQEEEEVEELQQPFQPPQFLRVPPPPQRFAPEGRHGIITEIEPEAEIIHSGHREEDPMQPHMHPGFQVPHSHPEPHPHPHPHPHPQPFQHSRPEILLPPPPQHPELEHHMNIENHQEHPHQEGPMAHPPLLLQQPPHPLFIHKAQPTITFVHPPPRPQEQPRSPPTIIHEAPSHTKIIHEPSTHAIIHQGPPEPLQMVHEAPSHTQVIHELPSHTQVIHEEPPQPQPIHEVPSHPQIIHLPPPPQPQPNHEEPAHPQIIHLPPTPQPSHPQMVHDGPPHPMIHGAPVPPPMPHEAPSHPPTVHDADPQPPMLHDVPPQLPEGRAASLERRAADDSNRHTLLVLN